MIIRTYNIICPSCNGTGRVSNNNGGCTGTTTDVCKACHGSGLVVVTETVFEPLTPFSIVNSIVDCELQDGVWFEKLP